MAQVISQCRDIIIVVRAHRADLERLGVRHLALYGSRVRGDARTDSDLDVMIDLDPSAAAGDRPDAEIAMARAELAISGTLSEICGLDVSVAVGAQISPEMAARLADDPVEVF